MIKDNSSDENPDDFPDHFKQVLSLLPKKRKIGRNEPCPCYSGKKYKQCCLGKQFVEIQKKYFENCDLKQKIISFVEQYPDDSHLLLRLDKEEVGISTTYGPYTYNDMALYFARKNIDLSETEFDLLFEEIREYLEKNDLFSWISNKIVDIDLNQTKEIELIFLGFHKNFVLKYLSETEDYVLDMSFFQLGLLHNVAKMIHDFLEQKGLSSSYPRYIKDFDLEMEELLQEQDKHFYIECRATQKLLYMTSFLEEIKEKCESHIEFALAKELALNNVPFIQQQEITKSYPMKKEGEHVFTKPDLLLWSDESPIAIYCDGHDFHSKKEDQFRDRIIDRKLTSMGFIVLRYTGTEIHNNIKRCVEDILNFYIGNEWAKTPQDVLLSQLNKIDAEYLNEWETRFYNSISEYLTNDMILSLKQERKLKQIVDKCESKKSKSKSSNDYLEYELKDIERKLEIKPQDGSLWYNKSVILTELNRYDEALKAIDKSVELDSSFDFAWLLKSNILFKLGQYENALNAIEKVLEIDPEFEEALANKSTFLFKLNRYDEALLAIDESLKINSDLAESWSSKSNILYSMNAFDKALEAINRATEINPNFAGAWSNHANILNSLNRNKEALESIEKALKIDSNFYHVWSVKCTILLDLGEYKKALEAINKALKIEPNLLELWNKKWVTHLVLSEYEEALKAIDMAIKKDCNSEYLWFQKSNMLYELNKYDEALEAVNRVLKIKPNHAEAWFIHADILNNLQQNEEALESIEEALKIDSKQSHFWTTKCTILSDLGDHETALEAVNKALEFNINYFNLIKKSFILAELNEFAEALETINHAIKIQPHDVYSWMRKGIIQYKMKVYDDAITSFTEVLSLDNEVSEAWYLLGCIHALTGNNEEALSCIHKSFELNPSCREIAFEDEDLKELLSKDTEISRKKED